MARPREFDIDEVLVKSMQVFWSEGYDGTSLSDIMEATKLQKGSIYKAFKDKHSLFLASLEHYLRMAHEFDKKHLDNSNSPKKAIHSWLHSDLKAVCGQTLKRGCLMINSLNDRAYRDTEVKNLISDHISALEKLLAKAIKRGQEIGEFRDDIKPTETAKIIISLLVGMITLTKGPLSNNQSLKIVNNILKMVEP